MDFKSYLKVNAQKIDDSLDEILSGFLNEVKKTNIKLLPFALGLINSCRGGKRIRGVLVKLGYEIASLKFKVKSSKSDIYKVGAAFEILHAALLIHDDIMDKSPTRRGQPALYKALGGDHRAISQAISVGDIGFYLPIKIITDSIFSDEYRIKALRFFSEVMINTGWGQILDMEEAKDNIEFIRLYKTAKYTISGPLQIGAILAGLDPTSPRLRGIKEFGDNLGIAFQIQDDILDKEAENEDFAKIQALEYASIAKKMINDITTDAKMKKILEEMTKYLVERNK